MGRIGNVKPANPRLSLADFAEGFGIALLMRPRFSKKVTSGSSHAELRCQSLVSMALPAPASEFNERSFGALTAINDRSVNTAILGCFGFRRRSRHLAWMLRATGVGVWRRRLGLVRCGTGRLRRVAYRHHAVAIGSGLVGGGPHSIAERRSCHKAGRSLRVEVARIHPASEKAAPSTILIEVRLGRTRFIPNGRRASSEDEEARNQNAFCDSPHGLSPVLGERLSPASASVKDLRYDA